MSRMDTACGQMKLWKWILAFVFGMLMFMFVMAFAEAFPLLVPWAGVKSIASLISGCGMLGVYSVWIYLVEKRKPSELNLRTAPKDIGYGLLVGFGVFCVITAILALLGCYHIEGYQFKLLEQLDQFMFFFVVAVAEEIMFRGYLFRMIDERFSFIVAIIISALVFGLVHWSNPNGTLWAAIAIAIEAGIMLALAYKLHNSLWLPIGIHWGWNYTQGNIFGFGVSGNDAGTTFIVPSVEGHELITGGDFGPEASITAVVLCIGISAWFWMKVRRLCQDTANDKY